jgi:hypothetical protein
VEGRIIGIALMLLGIGFIAVLTGTVASQFIQNDTNSDEMLETLRRIDRRCRAKQLPRPRRRIVWASRPFMPCAQAARVSTSRTRSSCRHRVHGGSSRSGRPCGKFVTGVPLVSRARSCLPVRVSLVPFVQLPTHRIASVAAPKQPAPSAAARDPARFRTSGNPKLDASGPSARYAERAMGNSPDFQARRRVGFLRVFPCRVTFFSPWRRISSRRCSSWRDWPSRVEVAQEPRAGVRGSIDGGVPTASGARAKRSRVSYQCVPQPTGSHPSLCILRPAPRAPRERAPLAQAQGATPIFRTTTIQRRFSSQFERAAIAKAKKPTYVPRHQTIVHSSPSAAGAPRPAF